MSMNTNILLRRRSEAPSRPRLGYVAKATTAWLMFLVDLIVILVTLGLALWIIPSTGSISRAQLLLLPAVACFPIAKLLSGLYPGHGLIRSLRLRQALTAAGLALLGALAIEMLLHLVRYDDFATTSLRSLHVAEIVLAVLLVVTDPIARRILIRVGRWHEPVVVFGGGDGAAEVVRQLHLDPHLGYTPICVVDDNSIYLPEDEQGVPLVRSNELARVSDRLQLCTTAIVIERLIERSTLLRLYTSGIFERVLLVPECHDLISLKSEVRNLGALLTIEVRSDRLSPPAALLKRSADVIVSAVALLLLSPLLLVLALLVKIDSRGPVFYRQPRWAGDERSFTALKFRSMHSDGERRLERYFLTNASAQAEFDRFHKLTNDPRVTRVGRLLRAASLDELPQLINVLRGDMSMVGPRPYTFDELRKLGPARAILSLIRPGITGYWQVSGRNRRTFRERIAMDTYYVRNISVSLDLWIIYRTVISVLTADGK
jgi:Undecaprenyl-phosphate galactose phosphotransferase WbaP